MEPEVVSRIDLYKLDNTWFVTHDYNWADFCEGCQKITFDIDFSNNEEPFELNFVWSQPATNGSLVWNDLQSNGIREGNIFYFYGRDNGIDYENEWSILYSSADTMVVYYCSSFLGIESDGAFVLSTQPRLRKDRVNNVRAALARVNLKLEDFCELSPAEECIDAPAPFTPYEKRDPPDY